MTRVARYQQQDRKETYIDVAYLSLTEGDAVRARKKTRWTGRKIHAEILALPNRARERHPYALLLDSNTDTQETDDLSFQGDDNEVMVQEGTSLPTTYLLTGSEITE